MFPRRLDAFTLAEVMAALVLMAIVIPVAMECTSIASRTATLGLRKAGAARVAQRILNEAVATGASSVTGSNGTVIDDDQTYTWALVSETWPVDSLEQLTVTVSFTVQGDPMQISVSTLLDATATSTASQ